jgi:phosphatidylglycerophosphate synthase
MQTDEDTNVVRKDTATNLSSHDTKLTDCDTSNNLQTNVKKISYKYVAPIENYYYKYVMSPLCNKAVEYVPQWVHPNVLTLIGLLCSSLSMLLVVNDLKFFGVFAGLFWLLYDLFDNMDGKHARRTNKSSLLGELLDHICDSYSAVFAFIITNHILRVPFGFQTLWFLTVTAIYYCDHWQACFTKKLTAGNKFFGTNEVNLCLSINIILWGFGVKLPWYLVFMTASAYLIYFSREHLVHRLDYYPFIQYSVLSFVIVTFFEISLFNGSLLHLAPYYSTLVTSVIFVKNDHGISPDNVNFVVMGTFLQLMQLPQLIIALNILYLLMKTDSETFRTIEHFFTQTRDNLVLRLSVSENK